jgi:hypothetical protein
MRVLSAIFTVLLLLPAPGAAQTNMSSGDVQRLQDELSQLESELSRLRSSSPDQASRLSAEFEEISDEVIYLRVKLRKEGNVPRSAYHATRDRIDALLGKIRGGGTASATATRSGGSTTGAVGSGSSSGNIPATGRSGDPLPDSSRGRAQGSVTLIPAGQEIDVRLQTALSSATAQVEDRFEATTVADLYEGNRVLIPAGSVVRGVVRTVDRATRTDRKGQITVSFDQITVGSRNYPMRGTVTEALESEGMRGEAARIGAGAGVGAIIGGIIGGVKGALLGVLIGGGGTIAATEGTDVNLKPGTILRVRLDTPPDIR